jgi:succinate-semialdehyde dehydrogenase/glutarate-semialdehyde dehydrogenase
MLVSKVQLVIDSVWCDSVSRKTVPVMHSVTGARVGEVAHAQSEGPEIAVNAAAKGFKAWRKMSRLDRSKIMRSAADLLRQRVEAMSRLGFCCVAHAASDTIASSEVLQ